MGSLIVFIGLDFSTIAKPQKAQNSPYILR
jgi:hypothetical protein